MRNKPAVTVALLLLALLLRCVLVTVRGIQYDDAFSILLARSAPVEIISGTAADTMPPLYYFFLHAWMLVSTQIGWCRLLSILLSLGALVFLFLSVKSLVGWEAANWALLFGAISPFQVYHAQDIRMYALLQFFLAGYVFFFLSFLQSGRWQWRQAASFILMGAGAMYSHNLAAFFLAAPNVYLLLARKGRLLGRLLAAQAGILALFLPWVFYLPAQLQKIQTAFWTPQPGLVEVLQAIITFTGSLTLPTPWLPIVAAMSALAFLLAVYTAARSVGAAWDKRLLIFTLVFWAPTALFVFSYVMRPIFVPRAFIASSLYFYALLGMVMAKSKPRWLRWAPGLLALGAAAVSLPNVYLFDQFPRSPFNAAVEYALQHSPDGTLIVHDNKLSYFPSVIYHPEARQTFLADLPNSANDTFALASQAAMHIYPATSIEAAVGNANDFSFIVFTRAIREFREMGLSAHPVIAWLDGHYRLVSSARFGDLEVFRYHKP